MRVGLYALVTLLMVGPVAAQPRERLAIADVVAEALRSHPEIAAAEHRYEAARQRPAQERSLPDPMVSAGYNSSGNPLPGAGLGTEPTANIGVMVSQESPYPGKLALRSAMASREADAERQQIAAARLSVTARVKQAYYSLASAYAIGDVLARNKALLDTLLKVSEVRYSVGRAAQQDVLEHVAALLGGLHHEFEPGTDFLLPGELAEHRRPQGDVERGVRGFVSDLGGMVGHAGVVRDERRRMKDEVGSALRTRCFILRPATFPPSVRLLALLAGSREEHLLVHGFIHPFRDQFLADAVRRLGVKILGMMPQRTRDHIVTGNHRFHSHFAILV